MLTALSPSEVWFLAFVFTALAGIVYSEWRAQRVADKAVRQRNAIHTEAMRAEKARVVARIETYVAWYLEARDEARAARNELARITGHPSVAAGSDTETEQ